MSTEPIEAVRAGPANFFLAVEAIIEGLRFRAGDTTYRPKPMGTQVCHARVRRVDGATAGSEFTAQLQVGQRIG